MNQDAVSHKTIAVVLLNMGGPETTDDIKPYLYNLFCDRNIIQLPASFLLQKPLARFIAARRTPVVTERYRAIRVHTNWCNN